MRAEVADCSSSNENDSAHETNHLNHLQPSTETNITDALPSSKTYHINRARPSGLSNDLMACTKSPSPSSDPIPHFYISTTIFSKPSITLHSGPNKTSSVLGVAYLTHFSSQNFLGIGDPDPVTGSIRDGKEVIWEGLNRVSKWLHGVYGFSFATALGGVREVRRRRFLWKRTRMNIFDDQGDMELVEDCGDVDGGESEGEVLARYESVGVFKWSKRGRLTIKEGGDSAWEVIVILSAMSLVELSRRRARQRRHM